MISSNKNIERTAQLGKQPIIKLVLRMSVPAIISMLVTALYNVVDTLFISRIGSDAISAISYTFPMQMIIIAFGVGVGVGANAIVSRKLGERNYKSAEESAKNAVFISLVIGIAFLILGYPVSLLYYSLIIKSKSILNLAIIYGTINFALSIFILLDFTFGRIIQATGNVYIPMISQSCGAIINIILDAIFIFVFKWGIVGAAVATIIGEICALSITLTIFYKKKFIISLSFKKFKPNIKQILVILKLAVPLTILNSMSSIAITALNSLLTRFSENAVAAYGIYYQLQSFIFMPIFGINQGIIPILAYNFGALNKKRYFKTYLFATSITMLFMAFGMTIMQVMPEKLIEMFKPNMQTYNYGIDILKTISIGFAFSGFGIILTAGSQSVGRGFLAMSYTLFKQLVIVVPLAYVLSLTTTLSVKGVWYAHPISEASAFLVFIPLSFYLINKSFKKQEKIKLSNFTA